MTIAGISSKPSSVSLKLAGQDCDTSAIQFSFLNNTLYVTDLDSATSAGAWSGELVITLS